MNPNNDKQPYMQASGYEDRNVSGLMQGVNGKEEGMISGLARRIRCMRLLPWPKHGDSNWSWRGLKEREGSSTIKNRGKTQGKKIGYER